MGSYNDGVGVRQIFFFPVFVPLRCNPSSPQEVEQPAWPGHFGL